MRDPNDDDREPTVGSDTGYEHTTGDRDDHFPEDEDRDSTQTNGDDSGWITLW